jgi:dihydrofolate synthase/folylpolyglutamate synthase
MHHPVLDQLAASGMRLGLEQVKSFLDHLGEPHRAYPVIHVAGTNGKGSVCTYVTQALVEAGYRVGTTMSPHLEAVNERVRLDGVPVDDALLLDAIESLDRARWDWARSAGITESPLTYFEFTTVLAFQVFAASAVDVAVVEVGMGGRLDATNVVQPNVCAITSIGFDHMEHLGNTLGAIAGEKAGILKRGVPVVIGALPPEARQVVELRAKQLGAPLWRPGNEMTKELRKTGWQLRTPGGTLQDVNLTMRGLHQGTNALVALGVLHQLRKQGFHVPDEALKAGLQKAMLGGRLETLLPGLIVDGAHNEEGATALAAWLASQPRPKNRILVLGMGIERDPAKFVKPLLPHVDEIVTTMGAHPKAREPEALGQLLESVDAVVSIGDRIEDTLPEVYREADETIVTGSLYLVGAARSLVREGALDGITPGQGPAADAAPEDSSVG